MEMELEDVLSTTEVRDARPPGLICATVHDE